MYKKSSSNSGGGKKTGGSFKKEGSRSGSFDKKPYKKPFSGGSDDRPARPSRDGGSAEGGTRFRKDDSRGSGFEKKPYKKEGGYRANENSDRPRKPFREGGAAEGSSRPRRDDSRDSGFEKKPFKKEGGYRANENSDRPRKPFRDGGAGEGSSRPRRDDSRDSGFEKKPFRKEGGYRGNENSDSPRKPFREGGAGEGSSRPRRDDSRDSGFEKKPFRKEGGYRSNENSDSPRKTYGESNSGYKGTHTNKDSGSGYGKDNDRSERPSFRKSAGEDRPRKEYKKPYGTEDRGDDRRPSRDDRDRAPRKDYDKPARPAAKNFDNKDKQFPGMPDKKRSRESYKAENRPEIPRRQPGKKANDPVESQISDADYYGDDAEWELAKIKKPKRAMAATFPMPLNKYIAHSGECSRRDAAELVKQGKAKVNGELVTDPGHKVNEDDKISLSGKKLTPQKGLVYILLNKPKGFITTNEDERGRRTVMDLINSSDVGRVFPIGRLDRATTGLLLMTNDGDLTQKLSHPSYNVKKVYQVTLDKILTQPDFDKIMAGIELEDGKAEVDEMAYLEKKNELGLEIHSGKNRIVRRIFESLGYEVEKLDRMMYAGLTKKNLPRGKWRFLNDQEILLLKHFKS